MAKKKSIFMDLGKYGKFSKDTLDANSYIHETPAYNWCSSRKTQYHYYCECPILDGPEKQIHKDIQENLNEIVGPRYVPFEIRGFKRWFTKRTLPYQNPTVSHLRSAMKTLKRVEELEALHDKILDYKDEYLKAARKAGKLKNEY